VRQFLGERHWSANAQAIPRRDVGGIASDKFGNTSSDSNNTATYGKKIENGDTVPG